MYIIKSKLLKNTAYLVFCIKRLYNGHVFEPEIQLPRIFPKEANQYGKINQCTFMATLFDNHESPGKETECPTTGG